MVKINYKNIIHINTYGITFFIYLILFLSLTFHYWGQGQIITPYNPTIELALPDHTATAPSIIENRKFGDFQSMYIPEITEQFKEAKSGWLALWNKQNELGRPIIHLSGFSPAYPPSWIMAQLTYHNPYSFITVLSLFSCFLSGIFIILFCKELELAPLAGLIAGTSFATSPFFMYWLTFPMCISTFCWAAGIIWALTRLAKKMDLFSWSVLSFSLYSLLMTGYPQITVNYIYIFLGYGLYLSYQKQKLGWMTLSYFWALSLSAALLAVGLALPIYLDLLNVTLDSYRTAVPLHFFTAQLIDIGSLGKSWKFLTLSTFPELAGNPIKATYPFPYNTFNTTTLVLFFSVLCLYTSFKKTWGWWLAIVCFILLSTVAPIYIFAVRHLGFNLSSSTPFGSIILPVMLIVAYGIDALMKRANPRKISQAVLFSTIVLFLAIISAIVFVHYQALPLHRSLLLPLFIVLVLLAMQYKKTYPILLLSATILIMVEFSYPLMFHQNIKNIPATSRFIEKIHAELSPDSRYAIAAPESAILLPNLNATLRLPSIHSYNTLASKRYQHFIAELNGKGDTKVWRNKTISPNYNSTPFWMSNISLILSTKKINNRNLSYQGEDSGIYFYKVLSRMGQSIQVIPFSKNFYATKMQISDPRVLPHYTPVKQLDQSDTLEFAVQPTVTSILILSQNFNSGWRAQVFQRAKWIPAKTVLINGVFQGVWLPANTEKVRLEFKSYTARFAWIAPVFWLLLLIFIILKYSLCRKKSS